MKVSFLNPPRMRTIRQAAKEAGVPVHWLRQAVKDNRVIYVMAGRTTLVNLDKLIEFLERGEQRKPTCKVNNVHSEISPRLTQTDGGGQR